MTRGSPGTVTIPQYQFKGGPEPLGKEIHKILGSKREDRISDPFFKLVKKKCQVRFSTCFITVIYVRARGHCESSRRSARRYPGVESALFMVPDLQLPRHLAHPLWNDPVWTISRVNHGLTQLAPVPSLEVLTYLWQALLV